MPVHNPDIDSRELRRMVIEACELTDGDGEMPVLHECYNPFPAANQLPESIIQYVIRTQESVILNNATREGNLSMSHTFDTTKLNPSLFAAANQ